MDITEKVEQDGFMWVHDYYLVFSIKNSDGLMGYHAGVFTFDGIFGKDDIQTVHDYVKNEIEKVDAALLIGINLLGIRKIVKSPEEKS